MIPGVVRLKTLAAKSIGVAFSVSGGLCVGKVFGILETAFYILKKNYNYPLVKPEREAQI